MNTPQFLCLTCFWEVSQREPRFTTNKIIFCEKCGKKVRMVAPWPKPKTEDGDASGCK